MGLSIVDKFMFSSGNPASRLSRRLRAKRSVQKDRWCKSVRPTRQQKLQRLATGPSRVVCVRAVRREQGAGSRGQGAGSSEQRAESNEQRAASSEQRAESREQRAESKDHLHAALCTLRVLVNSTRHCFAHAPPYPGWLECARCSPQADGQPHV